jgi:hypothetical protein
MTTKTAAQHRADRIKAFAAELAQLARDKILALNPEQARAVADCHAGLLAHTPPPTTSTNPSTKNNCRGACASSPSSAP